MRLERVSPLPSPRLRGPRLQGPQPRGPQLRRPREPGGRKMGNWILVLTFKLNKLPVSQPSPSRLLLLVQP